MHVAPVSTADEILPSLESVYRDMSEAAGINPMVDGELEVVDLEELRDTTETLTVDDYAHCLDSVDDFSKKKMHELMLEDSWIVSNEKLAVKDILHVHAKTIHC